MRNNEDEIKEQLTEKQISFTGQTTNHVHKTKEELQFQYLDLPVSFGIVGIPHLYWATADDRKTGLLLAFYLVVFIHN